MPNQNQTAVTEISVTLLKPHTHAGQSYQANDTLTVSQTTADWLIKNGVAELAKPEKADEKAEPAKPKAKPDTNNQ
ncbi:DUF7210 family protein [Moraxella equi]|uniref:DUF7210 domain-containing protein n=1 Tax=Moraxella equi TaxID=60442 RepID=A0A378QPQ8_9GAMM|nr:hypothetical protein [Moraxella equi]OPH34965.1 hypothetical protein B5J93_11445 [Moraxella equi]STZ02847.1 Uncharacterised protein [Moraxella equi]